MGYNTDYRGKIRIEPPLNEAEIDYLQKFSESRRMYRKNGPYFVDGSEAYGQGRDADIMAYNDPPPCQPGLWCKFIANDEGNALVWTGDEKTYDGEEWIRYLIDHFLKPDAEASKIQDDQFAEFTFNHICNGVMLAQGEETGDVWRLVVRNNVVMVEDFSHLKDGVED